MSTDAGSAAAPEDTATREEASDRPGLESDDPQSADSATSTPETADRGVEGSASSGAEDESTSASDDSTDDSAADSADADTDSDNSADTDTGSADTDTDSDDVDADSAEAEPADTADRDSNPASEGFIATMLRDATITGLPGETGAPPVEPHSPEAQQEGDEPVGSEPRAGDNPDGVD